MHFLSDNKICSTNMKTILDKRSILRRIQVIQMVSLNTNCKLWCSVTNTKCGIINLHVAITITYQVAFHPDFNHS